MNKYTKISVVCFIVSLISTIVFTLITMDGVTYSPGISSTEMDTMTYSEVANLMEERAQSVSANDFISANFTNSWFWKNTIQVWLAFFITSFISYFLIDKWLKN